MAKNKKLAKKDIEKFAQKVIARFTESIIGAVFAKIESDPELKKEYFSLCGLGDIVEEKPAKAKKAAKPVKAVKEEKPAKAKKVAKAEKAVKVTKPVKEEKAPVAKAKKAK